MRKFLLAAALFCASVAGASAQTAFTTPGGSGADGKVGMHLNANGQAVPDSVAGAPGGGGGAPVSAAQQNGDPCSSVQHVYTPINIGTTGSTKLVAGAAGKKTYVCHLFLFAASADSVAITEGTGTNCATGTAGVIGGPTTTTGLSLAANEGAVLGTAENAVAATATAGDDLCISTSASVQLSGTAVTVQQ